MDVFLFNVLASVSSIFWLAGPVAQAWDCEYKTVQAICILQSNPSLPPSDITGVIYFTQSTHCLRFSPLEVKGRISGMPTNGKVSFHGMHVHRFGIMSPGCEAMGGHYNPFRVSHGARGNSVFTRHVGDFGNVVKDAHGEVTINFIDRTASLVGGQSILHRGIVLHEGRDDLGRGGNAGSLKTGNAGRRLACCVIEPYQQ